MMKFEKHVTASILSHLMSTLMCEIIITVFTELYSTIISGADCHMFMCMFSLEIKNQSCTIESCQCLN